MALHVRVIHSQFCLNYTSSDFISAGNLKPTIKTLDFVEFLKWKPRSLCEEAEISYRYPPPATLYAYIEYRLLAFRMLAESE